MTKRKGVRMMSLLTLAALSIGMASGCGDTGSSNASGDGPDGDTPHTYVTDLNADTYYNNGYTYNTVVGIDQFQRTFEAVAQEKEGNRDVGIFYFCTLGQHGATEIYDVTKILAMENGEELMFHTDNKTAPANQTYFWGEPLYGYYNSSDSWVIRKHLTLLTLAGVDFIVFDVTNAFTYDTVTTRIMKEICDMKEEGWDAPGLVFYTHAYSMRITRDLYSKFYEKGRYDDAWYYKDGKPLIIAYTNPAADNAESRGRGDTSYQAEAYPTEIREYFTFKTPQWPSEPFIEDGFPWIEWEYPAKVHTDVINVAVASHPALPMSFSVTRGSKNWGRGWNVETKENESDKAYEGTLFQATWDVAIEADPSMVFVLGWNEWVAGKSLYDGEYALVDCATMEFSRDAEMMRGGYNDAFYIQLAANIRTYKGISVSDAKPFESTAVTIPMTNDYSQWDDVKAVYKEVILTNRDRNSVGAATSIRYEQEAARNNIIEARVAQDSENLYFYIKASEDITSRENNDTAWMNIYIGTGDVSLKGWEGYEYVINRADVSDGLSTIEKLGADYSTEKVGEAEYLLDGEYMQVKIPRSALGLAADDNYIYFKIADGVEIPNDIMEYYVSGKSFPLGRLSYRYMG